MKTLLLATAFTLTAAAASLSLSGTAHATLLIEPAPASASHFAENDASEPKKDDATTDSQAPVEDAMAAVPSAEKKCVKSQDEAEKNCPSGEARLSRDADGCYHCKKLPPHHHLGLLRTDRFRG